eukprot:TRINITY_DN28822_c0_g1_i2.p1 TRINITY_DN28822_c0_g1~~TRINITY_DN28822_c0_g1_i2.p1  ORF type:complete len:524 (-),score=94.96 TRINITY_DN28822_c0_g1_i2:18-1589(-)
MLMSSDCQSHVGCDRLLVTRLLAEGDLPWSKEWPGLAAPALDAEAAASQLAEQSTRGGVLLTLAEALLPKRPRIVGALSSPVAECLGKASASDSKVPKPVIKGAKIASCPEHGGRGFFADGSRLERGSVPLREFPSASVPILDFGGGARLGPGKLSPETALALTLWWRARQRPNALTPELLDHGGGSAGHRLEQAAIAVALGLAVLVRDGVAPPEDGDAAGPARKVVKLAEELFRWLGMVRINAVAVTAVTDDNGSLQTSKVALALFPSLASSVNHSCRPNAILRFCDQSAVELVVTEKDGIDSGQEVCISYGPTVASMPREERRATLLAQYGFNCGCGDCISTTAEDYSWKARAKTLDERAEREARQGRWKAAAAASAAALTLLREGFCAGDVELAREECKLASLLLESGDVAGAASAWRSAAADLRLLVAPSDPDLLEAEGMLRSLRPPATPGTSRAQGPLGGSKGATVISNDFEGVILGMEHVINAKKAGGTAMQEPSSDKHVGSGEGQQEKVVDLGELD